MGYGKKVIRSIGWVSILRGFSRVASFFKFVVAARLLGPEGIGIFAVASLFLSFLEIITETGINAILVQNGKELKKYINTAWIISIIRGFIIFSVIILLAKPVSVFFKQPESYFLILLISLTPLIKGFVNPLIVKYQKDLEFNKEFIFRFPIVLVDMSITIILLYLTKNPSSLIWGMIISSVVEVVLSWVIIKPRPKINYDKKLAKEILNKGKWITSSGFFVYLFTQGDDWIVGKLLGAVDLGLYQMAYKLATIPTTETSNILLKVIFPTFVKIKDDIYRLRNAYLKITAALLVFLVPFVFLMCTYTEFIVAITFGIRWVSIVGLVKVITIFSGLMSVMGLSSALFLALNKQKYTSNIMLLAVTLMALTIVPSIIRFGLIGAGYSVLFSWIIACILNIYYIIKSLRYI